MRSFNEMLRSAGKTSARTERPVDGLFVGVPAVLGEGGLQRVMTIDLTADESAAFQKSAAAVRELVDKLA